MEIFQFISWNWFVRIEAPIINLINFYTCLLNFLEMTVWEILNIIHQTDTANCSFCVFFNFQIWRHLKRNNYICDTSICWSNPPNASNWTWIVKQKHANFTSCFWTKVLAIKLKFIYAQTPTIQQLRIGVNNAKCFAYKSAGLSLPNTFLNFNLSLAAISWIYKWLL